MRNLLVPSLLLVFAPPAHAQSRWKEIGKTSSGNSVYIDPRSVKTVNGIINARVRVKFDPPVRTPQGAWSTSQTLGMFDCAKQAIAAKETIYYADERTNKVVDRRVIAKPGFGPALGGSMAKLALDYLCAEASRARR
jgi:hypothetical protein